jgi:antitoxin CptB
MNNSIDNLKKKILYRSNYRGTKEMDNLIGTFVKSIIDDLDIAELYKLNIDENFVTKSFRKFKMNK